MREEIIEKRVFNHKVIEKAMTYEKYYQLIKELLQEGKTTGSNQTETYLKHARLNFQRMKRVYRTTEILDELGNDIKGIHQDQIWIVLSEGWCGDAAQSLPVMARLAEMSGHIDLRILLRDENPEIMDAYLTNGSKSIPKLIALDRNTLQELFTWGPRPREFQDMVMEYKRNPSVSYDEFNETLHKKYALDKTQSLQHEIHKLILGITDK